MIKLSSKTEKKNKFHSIKFKLALVLVSLCLSSIIVMAVISYIQANNILASNLKNEY